MDFLEWYQDCCIEVLSEYDELYNAMRAEYNAHQARVTPEAVYDPNLFIDWYLKRCVVSMLTNEYELKAAHDQWKWEEANIGEGGRALYRAIKASGREGEVN